MTLPELPALRPYATRGCSPSMKHAGKPTAYAAKSVHARESILVAEIERLRALWMAAEERAAHAEEAALSHADIIVKLRAECEAMRWPAKPTPAMRDALRTGSRRDVPSDELCAVRYAALMAARSAP